MKWLRLLGLEVLLLVPLHALGASQKDETLIIAVVSDELPELNFPIQRVTDSQMMVEPIALHLNTGLSNPTTTGVTSVSTLRLQLPIVTHDRFALRMGIGYDGTGNFSPNFIKTLSGVAFYPSVQIPISYSKTKS